jgi:hypothetical protein
MTISRVHLIGRKIQQPASKDVFNPIALDKVSPKLHGLHLSVQGGVQPCGGIVR